MIETGRSMAFNKKYYNSYLKGKQPADSIAFEFEDDDSFWVPVVGKTEKSKDDVINGYVRISITILPKEM